MSTSSAAANRGNLRNDQRRRSPCAMTIAGSDSGGGAGIEADLKTFSALGVFGTCVITAVTAQNTQGVREIFPVPAELVRKQIDVIMEDIPVRVAKTGMLYSGEVMSTVAQSIDKYELRVVVDPVLRAGTGDPLVSERGEEALIKLVTPRAYVLTPNLREAEAIADMNIKSVEDMKRAAERITALGAESVVVKGGHLETERRKVYDVFYHGGRFGVFEKPRVNVELHGAGCTFSAAIAAYLARGATLAEAVGKAEEFVESSIKHALRIGSGRMPVNPMAHLYNRSEVIGVLEDIENAARTVENSPEFLPFIAEVGTQVAMGLPFPSDDMDVAGIDGRIVKLRDGPRAVGPARFGVSRHLASVILTAVRHDPEMRAAINLHCHLRLVEAFRSEGFDVVSFHRSLEPADVKSIEGRSLTWGTEDAIRSLGKVPDVIYDEGEVGKEPMIRVLGRNATDVVNKALIAARYCLSRDHG